MLIPWLSFSPVLYALQLQHRPRVTSGMQDLGTDPGEFPQWCTAAAPPTVFRMIVHAKNTCNHGGCRISLRYYGMNNHDDISYLKYAFLNHNFIALLCTVNFRSPYWRKNYRYSIITIIIMNMKDLQVHNSLIDTVYIGGF